MKRLKMVYIILAATAIVVRNAVPAEAELHTGMTADNSHPGDAAN
jgi:hypothetical protein